MPDAAALKTDDANASGTTFTQEDLNRIAAKVRAEERAKFADYDATKREAEELRLEKHEREEREKTERQKEIDAAVKATESKLKKEHEQERMKWQVSSAVERELVAQGGRAEGSVFLSDVQKLEEVKERVSALLGEKPWLRVEGASGGLALGAVGAPGSQAGGASGPGVRVRTTNARIEELNRTKKWIGSPEQEAYLAGRLDVID